MQFFQASYFDGTLNCRSPLRVFAFPACWLWLRDPCIASFFFSASTPPPPRPRPPPSFSSVCVCMCACVRACVRACVCVCVCVFYQQRLRNICYVVSPVTPKKHLLRRVSCYCYQQRLRNICYVDVLVTVNSRGLQLVLQRLERKEKINTN